MALAPTCHSEVVLRQWEALSTLLGTSAKPVALDGKSVDICEVVSIARHGSKTWVEAAAQQSMLASLKALETRLANGEIVYGVNTGFGGTADVRTKQTEQLQRVLIRELHYGILPPTSKNIIIEPAEDAIAKYQHDFSAECVAELGHLPRTWARAAILLRINSLVKGYSGLRPVVVERLQDLLRHDIIPMIPLRGSISASGDLSPLSYVGGAIQGKSTIRIISADRGLTAERALAAYGLEPVRLQAKEGLAIVNGTAISTGAAALALHDAHTLAVLSQVLTAMAVEALTGTAESFHPAFGEARPHPGQIASACNIFAFLQGSKFVKSNDGAGTSLRQDRYSIRTAPQWLGPVLEDLVLAHQQIYIECNSATDNPLISADGEILHGGNFQAKAVTSAMEKTRQGMQSLGRMLYTQCTELINPSTSRGLPPNLTGEDPSSSFIFKGADIHAAALLSELGFLSNPVNHVQTAEMGNQSLNSLALISTRYTHMAIEVLSQLSAVHLITLCQALDLRALHAQFLSAFHEPFKVMVKDIFQICDPDALQDIEAKLWQKLLQSFDTTVSLDAKDRFPAIAKTLRDVLLDHEGITPIPNPLLAVAAFTTKLSDALTEHWCAQRDAYLVHGDATPLLGRAAQTMYHFVRRDLQVPMLCSKVLETPPPEPSGWTEAAGAREPLTVGDYTGAVYRALRDGRLAKVAVDILREARGSNHGVL